MRKCTARGVRGLSRKCVVLLWSFAKMSVGAASCDAVQMLQDMFSRRTQAASTISSPNSMHAERRKRLPSGFRASAAPPFISRTPQRTTMRKKLTRRKSCSEEFRKNFFFKVWRGTTIVQKSSHACGKKKRAAERPSSLCGTPFYFENASKNNNEKKN